MDQTTTSGGNRKSQPRAETTDVDAAAPTPLNVAPAEATAPADAPEGEEATEFTLTLDEFCRRLSQSDRRVELIGAFFEGERVAGRMSDSDGAFRRRFTRFCNAPA